MNKEIEIIMSIPHITRKEAERYLKNGTVIYESYKDYLDSCYCNGFLDDEEEWQAEEIWKEMYKTVYDGKEYRVNFAL